MGHRPSGDRPDSGLQRRYERPSRRALDPIGQRFLGSAAGIAYALDAATGKALWINPIAFDGNSVVSFPIADRGLVYLTLRHFTNPSTGGVVALDAATGAVVWERARTRKACLW